MLVNFAWVTRPECPKGAKDEVKRPEGPPARSRGPEGPETSCHSYYHNHSHPISPNIDFFWALTEMCQDIRLPFMQLEV